MSMPMPMHMCVCTLLVCILVLAAVGLQAHPPPRGAAMRAVVEVPFPVRQATAAVFRKGGGFVKSLWHKSAGVSRALSSLNGMGCSTHPTLLLSMRLRWPATVATSPSTSSGCRWVPTPNPYKIPMRVPLLPTPTHRSLPLPTS